MAQILVVDDSSTVRDEVAGFLRKNGLEVDTAVDGKDGLSKLKTSPGIKPWNDRFRNLGTMPGNLPARNAGHWLVLP